MAESDNAITHKSQDKLDRNNFAEKLANDIMEYQNENALAIGITGKWGSGKSSLINLTLNKLNENNNVIIIKFNPWFFSNQNNLYYQFFKLLISTFKEKEIMDKSIFERKTKPQRIIFKKFGIDSLKDYFNFIDHSSIEFSDNAFHSLNFQDLESYESLESLKIKCDEYFENLDCKIVVVIDDIDRLISDEIKQIFTLVKSLANFKRFIYILSFDKNVVAKAFGDYHSDQDYRFMEKIVPVQIRVPDVSFSRLNKLILDELKPIYDEYLPNNIFNKNNNFERLAFYLTYFIKNIRDLKRYINILEFNLNDFYDNINFDDYLLMLAIQLFEYEIYLFLKNNRKLLTTKIDIFNKNENDYLNKFYDELKEINDYISFNDLKMVLNHLFPILKYHKHNSYPKLEYLHKQHRIGNNRYFDKYFTLSLETDDVSSVTLDKLTKPINIFEIYEIFDEKNNQTYNFNLFEELYLIADEIPKENCEPIITVLLKQSPNLNLARGSLSKVNWIIDKLFKKLESKERCCQIFEECIDFENNFFTIVDYIHHLSVKKNRTGTPIDDLIFSDECLENFEELIVSEINQSIDDETLFYQSYLSTILYYWKTYEENSVIKNRIVEKAKDDNILIEFLKRHILFDVLSEEGDVNLNVALDFDNLVERYFETLNEDYFGDLNELNTRMNKIYNDKNTSQNHKEFCKKFIEQFEKYVKHHKI